MGVPYKFFVSLWNRIKEEEYSLSYSLQEEEECFGDHNPLQQN